MCIRIWYMCVDTCRGKKCVPHIQELELEVVVSYLASVLGLGLRYPGKARTALKSFYLLLNEEIITLFTTLHPIPTNSPILPLTPSQIHGPLFSNYCC